MLSSFGPQLYTEWEQYAGRVKLFCNVVVSTAGAYVPLYTVPAGYRAIIQEAVFLSAATAPGAIILDVQKGAVHTGVFFANPGVQLTVYTLAQRFIVLDAGDVLNFFVGSVTGGNSNVIASGLELPL